MQYNYYSLYNITEARASDKHLPRIEKVIGDKRFATQMLGLKTSLDAGAYRHAKNAGYEPEATEYLEKAKANAAKADKSRKELSNLERQEGRLKTHIRDRKGEQDEKPLLTPRQLQIRKKIAENKARLEAKAKKKAAQHKTKIQQHGRKQKVGAVLAAGGLTGAGALLKSAHDDVTG